ncbi:kelch repeat and BTB domain-containing protein 8-like [Branchiostoma floridae]|uniref:Kelch repeat and BTB domain-containing protein 8-like n=1 Tax=Branchiostoma floridae TaxID=7739 RepID=A0A9J7N2V7_BRAFL|nr:kelch repeat and BTB domain-containing protein 8-like [Branchiostoma floridae]
MDATNEVHVSNVLQELNEQRARAELTDVVLEVEGRSFPCHRAVLASCSPYFRGMFTSGYAEAKQERISIQDVGGVAMATILDYAYTGRLQTEPDQVQAVMAAARLLQVDFVGQKAAEYMKDHLDVSNCVDVWMYADMLADCSLVEASKKYVASRFDQVALQPSFVQLPLSLLQPLLDKDDLMAKSEDNVVRAALRWVDFNQEERLQHLSTLSKSLRLSHISPELRVEMKKKCRSTDSKLVYSDNTAQRLGHAQTELQIFLREVYSDDEDEWSTPCYDPSAGRLHAIDMPENLDSFSRSVTVTPDDELYMTGDIVKSRDDRQSKFYQYNHLLNTWEPRCGMIEPRYRCGLVYLQGHIYAIGGDGASRRTAERYDPSCDEWTSIPPIPQPMSSSPCVVTLDDSIYVISKEGCYSFSTTENKWSKIADMLRRPVRPQAVTYRGCIYSIDCESNRDYQYYSRVEMYNPTKGEWKVSDGSFEFECDTATLMKYRKTMYVLIMHSGPDTDLLETDMDRTTLLVYQYQPKSDSWRYLDVKNKRRLFPPLAQWLSLASTTECLTVRMFPLCLRDPKAYERDYRGVGDHSDSSSSDSSGSDYSDSDDISDQEDGDEDNSNSDRQSGSDDEDI